MNKAYLDFLKKHDIDEEELERKGLASILSYEDLNPILAKGFQKHIGLKEVSVGDIVGFSKGYKNRTIMEAFKSCYNDNYPPYAYETRQLDKLQLDRDRMLLEIKKSVDDEPIGVIATEGGKYNFFINGLHRYSVLRLLYLSELVKIDGDEERIQKLKRKYTIKVDVTEIDRNKTYSKYLIMLANRHEIDPKKMIREMNTVVNENHDATDKVEICYKNGDRQIVNEEQLIDMARRVSMDKLLLSKDDDEMTREVRETFKKYESFRQFFQEVLPNVNKSKKVDVDKEEI